MHVLVLSDDAALTEHLDSALRVFGHTTTPHPSTHSSFSTASAPFSLAIATAPKPPLSHTIALLHRTPEYSSLPLLVLLSSPDHSLALDCLALGADDIITAPLDPTALDLRLRVVSHRRTHSTTIPLFSHSASPSSQFANLALDTLASPVIVLSPDCTVEFCNPATYALPNLATLSSNPSQRNPHSALTGLDHLLRACALIRSGEPSVDFEDHQYTLSGQRRRFAWHVSPVRDADNRLTHIVAAANDVTDRDRAQHALAASEAILRGLFDSAPFILGVVERLTPSPTGPEYSIVTCNGTLAHTVGIEPTSLAGTRIRDLDIPNTTVDFWLSQFELALTSESPTHFEFRSHKPGSPRCFSVTVAPIRQPSPSLTPASLRTVSPVSSAPPSPQRLCFVIEDVTERARLQSQLLLADRLISLGTLASGVSHEINNPLTFVVTNLEFLKRITDTLPSVPPSAHTAIARALEGAQRVGHIVRNLRTFARGDPEHRAPVALHQVLESSLEITRNELRHIARIVRDFSPVPLIEANESTLGQVFVNLLLNAAQAISDTTTTRTHEIYVGLRYDPGQHRVIATVRDTGQGMPPEILARVFDPFFTTRPIGQGAGLGLAIAHGIVRSLHGEIIVDSAPDKGTTVQVSFPVTRPATPSQPHSVEPPSPRSRLRVLIIDDEPNLLSSLALLLSADHDTSSSSSGRGALSRFEANERFDVILCDLMMPEVSGIDVYDTLARTAPDQAQRMLFLTGGAFTHRAQEFLDRVPNPHLEKPFDLDELSTLIRRIGASATHPSPLEKP